MSESRLRTLVSAAVITAVLMGITAVSLAAQPGESSHAVRKAAGDRGSCVLCCAPDYAAPSVFCSLPAPGDFSETVFFGTARTPAFSLQLPSSVRAPPLP